MTTDNIYFYLQNRLVQTSQTGGQWYSYTFPYSIPCLGLSKTYLFEVIYRVIDETSSLLNDQTTYSLIITKNWHTYI